MLDDETIVIDHHQIVTNKILVDFLLIIKWIEYLVCCSVTVHKKV